MTAVSLIFLTLAIATCTVALEFKDVEERYQCETFPVVSDFNKTWDWLQEVPYLYAPLWSKGFAYKIAEDYRTPEEISNVKETLSELGPSCFYLSFQAKNPPTYAYGKPKIYDSFPDPIRTGIRYFKTPVETEGEPAEYSSTGFTTLTDSKSYFLNINTWNDGSKNFFVAATVPVLPDETLSDIKNHLISHGFNPKHFDVPDYTNCTPPPPNLTWKNTGSAK